MTDVAVVIPCFDHGRTVRDALDSVLFQTRPAAEIVVVDDGSSEPYTRQVLEGLPGSGVRVVRQDHRGVAAARNHGVGLTSSPYVLMLDADDRLRPRYLEKTAEVLDTRPELDWVASAFEAFGERRYRWMPSAPDVLRLLARGGEVTVSSLLRRRMWDAIGGLDETLPAYEVWEFWIAAAERGLQGLVLDETLIEYRIQAGSRSHRGLQRETYVAAMRAMTERRLPWARAHAPELVLGKEAFLREQLAHGHTLRRRREERRRALDEIDREIEAARRRLSDGGAGRVDLGELRRLEPLSPEWGLDRGGPLDRHYIDRFLRLHRGDIRGRVLEIKDDGYTRRFGSAVGDVDVLDVDAANPRATVVADLQQADSIPEGRYDCFVLTQTLHIIYDVRAALRHALRILKPGGVLLCTLPAVSRVNYEDGGLDGGDFWRFTEASVRRLFAELLPPESFEVTVYGNVLASVAFLHGLAPHELDAALLEHVDPYFPLVFAVRAVKPRAAETPAPRTRREHAAAILLYHRIADLQPDPSGLCVPPHEFRAQMAYLRSHFRPVALRDLVRAAAAGRLPDRAVAVTLDDGYLDALTTASPILASLGIPATFFVNTAPLSAQGYVETFGDVVARALLVEAEMPGSLAIDLGGERIDLPMGNREERAAAFEHLYPRARRLDVAGRARLVRDLEAWLGRALAPRPSHRLLTADEVRELAGRPGHAIGAHTRSHLWLTEHDAATQIDEVGGGRRELEDVLGRAVDLFAYTYGAFADQTVSAVRSQGFCSAVTVEPGALRGEVDLWRLPRLEVKRGSLEAFVDLLHAHLDR